MAKWWLGLGVALMVMAGCGYRFPGEQQDFPQWVRTASVHVEDFDAWENPSLAKHLEFRLRDRLTGGQPGRGDREIHVKLQPRKDSVLTVQTSGRAMRREVVLRAEITVKEGDKVVGPPLALVEGRAMFSETAGNAPMQSSVGRGDAEGEALGRLVDTIAAVLATMP